ncbi:MAG TPA: hypothetical protein VNO51_04445 [Ilumatobacteraceae bacterium]|nr:hypothetical protein [Ilumatobacteraceae bacterium]
MTGDDHGRAEVYAAELAAYEGTELETVVEFDALVVLSDRVMSDAWWSRGHVQVRRARSDARSSTTRHTSRTAIHLAAPQMTPATLIHELAHVLAGVDAGHGARFRRAHVDLACLAFGSDRGQWLEAAYASAGLALGGRRWTPPAPAQAARSAMALGPIAL